MTATDPHERELDIVLFGATGFTGRLVAAHLAAVAPPDVRIGLAGRSLERLRGVRAALGPPARSWPLIVADALDAAALEGMARRSRVVATTAGPYSRYGEGVVAACVRAGTHYADLAGELLFVRGSVDRHHGPAAAAGVRIVHSCGFDSVPSDLAVLAAAERAQAHGTDLTDTTLVVRYARGGTSGGSIDSLRTQVDAARTDGAARRILADPYALSPDRGGEPDPGDRADTVAVRWDPQVRRWVGPFVMASFNARIVRRSNALQGWAYGRGFRYREVVAAGRGPRGLVLAGGLAGGLAVGTAAMALPPTRALLDRVLPAAGEGPDEDTRRRGRFRMDVHARTSAGNRYVSVVAAEGDPGYTATAVMLGQSALCLALDGERLPDRRGVLTPATAMGAALADRLRAQGFRLDVRDG